MRFDVKAMAITCGLLWGVALFVLTWWMIFLEGASGEPTAIGDVYVGYNISAMGSIIGLLWGLVDGFIGGAVFAWVYNRIASCCTKTE